jgi:hypothetical protein
MDKLPTNYSWCLEEYVDHILKPFTLKELFSESLKCNPRAQKAYLKKFQDKIHEAKGFSCNERVDTILYFWSQIKDLNAKSEQIGLCWEYDVIEAIRGTINNSLIYDASYAIRRIKEHNFETRWLIKVSKGNFESDDYYDWQPENPKWKEMGIKWNYGVPLIPDRYITETNENVTSYQYKISDGEKSLSIVRNFETFITTVVFS